MLHCWYVVYCEHHGGFFYIASDKTAPLIWGDKIVRQYRGAIFTSTAHVSAKAFSDVLNGILDETETDIFRHASYRASCSEEFTLEAASNTP